MINAGQYIKVTKAIFAYQNGDQDYPIIIEPGSICLIVDKLDPIDPKLMVAKVKTLMLLSDGGVFFYFGDKFIKENCEIIK